VDDRHGLDDRHRSTFDTLTPEELTLLILRDELYDGSWDEMRADLVGRREGKPFIFQLASRIDEDLERITRLARYEEEHNIDLGEYLDDED
jgi:hypothetical protein